MAITERINNLIKKSTAFRNGDNESFLPREVFRKIIDRERERANRSGKVFSLVVFELPDTSEKQKALFHLADDLSPRMRATDAAGWLDPQHVGILLPETDFGGAHIFANKVCQEILPAQLILNYEIFTYPSDKLTNPEETALDLSSGKTEDKQKRSTSGGGWRFPQPQRDADYMFCHAKRVLKRGFDILCATFFLLFFSPLFLVVAAIIKMVSPGPIFYKQPRIGYAGKPFIFLKFRTMCPAADTRNHKEYLAQLINDESDGSGTGIPMAKLDHDPQIIPLGNFLRKSCLDELPQLINVLRGEMSLVGPRPPIPYEVKEYNPWHRGRFDAIPGMTGLWQVSGKNKLSFKEMVRLDIRYSRQRSLWLDIKILFRTPLAIIEQLRGTV